MFLFSRIPFGQYLLEATAVGRKAVATKVQVDSDDVRLGPLVMVEQPIAFGEVLVHGQIAPAIQHGDTTEFNAAAAKVNRDATAEDLLTKLPGITVNNGTISSGGETIQRVLVDGKPFFGDDPTLAVRNLPAEVIDKIQVFDQMSEQAQFTGFDDGQSIKSLNIVTRRDRGDLHFGKAAAGYGDDSRYEAGGDVNLFDGDRRITALGLSNNVNEQNFSTQDILGVTSPGNQLRTPGSGPNRRGNGSRRGGNPFGRSGGAGGANPSLVGQQQGINTTSMIGLNAMDSLQSNLFAQGSYSFNRVDNENQQIDHRQYLLGGDSTSLYDQTSDPASRNFNHRINARLDYAADPSNIITVLPVLYFQSNRADNLLGATTMLGSSGIQSQSVTDALNSGYTLSGHTIYRHRFDLPGRTISIDLGAGASRKTTDGTIFSWDHFTGPDPNPDDTVAQQSQYLSIIKTLSGSLVYTEPAGVDGLFQLLYTPSFTRTRADKNTYDFDSLTNGYTAFDSPLSNAYTNDYLTQNAGFGYRRRSATMNFMATISYQIASLRGDDPSVQGGILSRNFSTVMPSALLLYTMPDRRSLRIYYRTFTRAPSVTQLQEVIDNSNPLLLSAGNPALNQSYSHTLLARYSLTAPQRSQSMFLLFSGTYTENYVATAVVAPLRDSTLSNGMLLARGSQLTYPVNLNGYWNARTFLTYGLPFNLISSALNLNSGISYVRTPGQINGARNTVATTALTGGVVIGSNISEDFDFTISYSGNYNISRSSLQPDTNGNYYSHTLAVKWVWTFWKEIVLRNDLSNAYTSGLSQGFNQNIILWNVSIAKKFFADDRGELKAGVSDILGQNKNVNRSITSSYIDDTQNEVLTRYFMVTFTYTVR